MQGAGVRLKERPCQCSARDGMGVTHLNIELQSLIRFQSDRVFLSGTPQHGPQLSAKDLRHRRLARFSLHNRPEPTVSSSPVHVRIPSLLTVRVVAILPFVPTSSHPCSSSSLPPSLFPASGPVPSVRSIAPRISSCNASSRNPRNSSASSCCPRVTMASKRGLGFRAS